MSNNCFVEYKNYKLEFIFKSVQPNVFEINPSLIFELSINIKNNQTKEIRAINVGANVSINDKAEKSYIGYAKSSFLHKWKNVDNTLMLQMNIDNYTLYQIEKKRNGGDLSLNLEIQFYAFDEEINSIEFCRREITHIEIPQSYWIKKYFQN